MRRKAIEVIPCVFVMLAFLVLPASGSASVTNTRIASGPSGTIATDSATFTFDSPLGGGFQCRLDSDDWWQWEWCASPKSYTSLADGPHRFEVRAVVFHWDHWHADPTPSVATFAVDTAPPETTIADAPSGTIDSSSATFAFDSPQPGTFECRLDSTDPGDWAPCASPTAYAPLADGPHTFEVRAVNGAGNADPTPSAATFAVDTTPPETSIADAPSGTIATGSATLAFTATEPGAFECRLDSTDPGDWAPCASPRSLSALADGPHTFEVRASDQFGNVDPTPAAATFAVDTTPPETTITGAPSDTIGSSSATFAFSSSEPGGFRCRLDSTDPGAWSPCASPRSLSPLADGPHTFEVRASDQLGNADPSPATDSFTVYTGPPQPVAGESINLEPLEGTVELQCPGEDEYSRLTSFKQVPLGCLVNTRRGVVDLTASKGSSGQLQGAHFWGGVFIVSQEHGDDKAVELKLAGRRMCERRSSRVAGRLATASRSRGGGRKVWGSGKGNYKTSGSYGSATVRGTTWLVVDRCDASTLIKVAEGTVSVRDFVKEKLLTLTAGQQYIAKAPIPRLDPDLWH